MRTLAFAPGDDLFYEIEIATSERVVVGVLAGPLNCARRDFEQIRPVGEFAPEARELVCVAGLDDLASSSAAEHRGRFSGQKARDVTTCGEGFIEL